MIGAASLASYLEKTKTPVTHAFNIEMIGKPYIKDSFKLLIKSNDDESIVAKFNNFLPSPVFTNYPKDDDFFSEYSEHIAINNILKKPCFTITSFNINQDNFYMTPKDDYEHIDINHTQKAINTITYAIYKLIAEK